MPGTRDLMGYLLLKFPYTSSMGIYNCRPVSGSSVLSQHSCGRAGDSGIPTLSGGAADTILGFPVVRFLADNSSFLGIVEQIYNRVIYDDASPTGRYYGGVHPHRDHIHWTQTQAKATSLTYAQIVAELGQPQAEGDDLLGFSIGKMGEPSVRGDRSAALQLMLNDRGASPQLIVDGIAGDATRQELIDFQTANAIGVPEKGSGVIGPYTYAKLYKPGSGGITGTQLATAIGTHERKKASGIVHPHGHDEGATGPPV